MNLAFTYEDFETSESLEAYVAQKMKNDRKAFIPFPVQIEISIKIKEKNIIECAASVSNINGKFKVVQSGRYIYDCVDRLIDDIKAQLAARANAKGHL